MDHPIKKFIGKTIEDIIYNDEGNIDIKFTDNRYGTIHLNFPCDTKEERDKYKLDFMSKRLYIVAGVYPDNFTPKVWE